MTKKKELGAHIVRMMSEKIHQTDRMIAENFPMHQPYIYTADGDAVVIRKRIGFDLPERQMS